MLLDNFTADQMRQAVELTGGRARLEASGGLTFDNAAEVATTGVDYVAVGALTHSVKVLDIGADRRRCPMPDSAGHFGRQSRWRCAMLLTIDVGNTNTVLSMFDGENLHRSFRVKTDPRATADRCTSCSRSAARRADIDGIALCSTVPAVLRESDG